MTRSWLWGGLLVLSICAWVAAVGCEGSSDTTEAPWPDAGPADASGDAPVDAAPDAPATVCGDAVCDVGETCASCPADCACSGATPCVSTGPCAGACATSVGGATDEELQAAIDAAAPGATLLLAAGDWAFDHTVSVNQPLTICGAASLTGVAVMEAGDDVPPAWDGTPTRLFTSDDTLDVLHVEADDVKLIGLELEGVGTPSSGTGVGIAIANFDRLTVEQCEAARFMEGVDFSQSQQGRVHQSWLHDDALDGMGYGVVIAGTSMTDGGSTVLLTESEFALDRHAIASNSPETHFVVESCYFHDSNPSQLQPDVDAHPQGLASLRLVVRNSFFKHTRPIGVKAGSLEITGNLFDSSCGQVISQMILLGQPTHNGNIIDGAYMHDVYIGNNHNESGQDLLTIDTFDYPPVKYVAYNVYADGELWESVHVDYPPYDVDPRPLVGHMFVTDPGGTDPLAAITRGVWYDLHVMAVDPQGAGDVAEIAAQMVDLGHYPHVVDPTADGAFAAAGDYFIRRDPTTTSARETEGDGAWTAIAGTDTYVDAASSSWTEDAANRVHVVVRFQILPSAAAGSWRLYGYVRDAEGNVPTAAWLDDQEGWPIRLQ